MKDNYLNQVTKLLKQTRPRLTTQHRLEFKNVFGAIGAYVDGRIFVSYGKFGIALKLPKEIIDELFKEKNGKRLRHFAKGHIKKEYVVLSRRILKNKRRLKKLVDQSIQYVGEL